MVHTIFILELTVSIIEKERTKTAVSGSEVGEIEALAVLLKEHGHGAATESPFTQRRY